MDSLLAGRFESFTSISEYPANANICGEDAALLLECSLDSVSHAQLAELFSVCLQRRTKLLLPVQLSCIIPLISAAYDISVAPLRTLVRVAGVESLPLPYPLAASSTSSSSISLRPLDADTVLLVTQQIDPLCLLLKISYEASCGATWLGLYTNAAGVSTLQVAVGVSAQGQVWMHRRTGYQDWKQVAGVLQATLRAATQVAAPLPRLVCVVPAADQVLTQALTSPYGGFSPPSTVTVTATTLTATSSSASASGNPCDVEITKKSIDEEGCFDCIIFHEDISTAIPLSVLPPYAPALASTPNLLFLLAGQSNMSGRGRLSDLVADADLQDVRTVHGCSGLEGCGTSPFVLKPCAADGTTTPFLSPSSSSSKGQGGATGKSQRSVHLSPPYARRVKAFDAKDFVWTELDPMTLHSRVDARRDARFGPGVTFATHLVELMEENEAAAEMQTGGARSRLGCVVGLVPTAVGATFLEEWAPIFRHRDIRGIPKCRESLKSSGPKSVTPAQVPAATPEIHGAQAQVLFLTVPENANYQPEANRGCHNLLACALRSFYGALLQAAAVHVRSHNFSSRKHSLEGETEGERKLEKEGGVEAIRALVGGLVWSQGCNDSIDVPSSLQGTLRYLGQAASDTYGNRQAAFMSEVRWCLEGVVHLVHQQIERKNCTYAGTNTANTHASTDTPLIPPLPPFPIVMVAVTGTRPWMVHLRAIRQEQLMASTRIPRLLTVDSLGSFLKTDCVHLTTAAALSLGHLLAVAMQHLLSAPSSTSNATTTADSNIAVGVPLLSIADIAPPHDLELYAAFCSARCRCEEVLNDYYNNMTREDRLKNKKKYPIFGTGLKPVNFVYGEIHFQSLLTILRYIDKHRLRYEKERWEEVGEGTGEGISTLREHRSYVGGSGGDLSVLRTRRFVDLGCGAGVACAAAALSGSFTHVLGIELMVSKIEACRCMLRCLDARGGKGKETGEDLLAAAFVERSSLTVQTQTQTHSRSSRGRDHSGEEKEEDQEEGNLLVQLEMREGNFLQSSENSSAVGGWDGERSGSRDHSGDSPSVSVCGSRDWVSWDVVYMACTMFAPDQMQLLYSHVLLLPQGAYLILLDKQLPNTSDSDDITKVTMGCFELAMSCQGKASWGTTMVYVYHKFA